jgi:hypothetical protein
MLSTKMLGKLEVHLRGFVDNEGKLNTLQVGLLQHTRNSMKRSK